MRTLWMASLLLAASAALPVLAQAQELHAGDIEIEVVAGALEVAGAAHFHGVDGYAIFEGDFGDLAGGLYRTDDPGYDSEVGSFLAGSLVSYSGLGQLTFWNGSTWSSAAVPSGVTVKIDGNLGEVTEFTSTGVSGDIAGLVGQAGADGKVHEHLDLSISGSGRTTAGAYLIQLQLTSPTYASSQPFYIALNRGLSDEAFEHAVQTLAVPEPGTWALTLVGLTALGWMHRRRRQA